MKAKLKTLDLFNFKGLTTDFAFYDDRNIIKGDNRTGKTTLMDAYIWLLFGTDSQGKTDFEIKPVADQREKICSVSAEFDFDNAIYMLSLKKIYKEKWKAIRGSEEKQFVGNETEFYVNDCVVTKNEYEQNIAEISDVEILRVLSDPRYFARMHWKKRCEFLENLVDKDAIITEIIKAIELEDVLKDMPIEYVEKRLKKEKTEITKKLHELTIRGDQNQKIVSTIENLTVPDVNTMSTIIATIREDTFCIDGKKESQRYMLNDIEKNLDKIDRYHFELARRTEEKINAMFEYVQFRMFKKLVNGDLEQCCDIVVDGVPYEKGLNNAAQINAGLEIIRTVSDFYDIHFPVFIDNAESITKLHQVDTQTIELYVSEDYKEVELLNLDA
jgi:hypothetical protein